MPDVLQVADALGIENPHYSEELALFRDEGASIVCRDTPENKQTLALFNDALAEMKRSGELGEILGSYVFIVE